jgi:purine-cytosine permease-like protein
MPLPPNEPQAPQIRLFNRTIPMPQARWLRILIGVMLIFGGFLGFLPILGFWMAPLGVVVLSYEFAWVRRQRRRVAIWWGRRKSRKGQP